MTRPMWFFCFLPEPRAWSFDQGNLPHVFPSTMPSIFPMRPWSSEPVALEVVGAGELYLPCPQHLDGWCGSFLSE